MSFEFEMQATTDKGAMKEMALTEKTNNLPSDEGHEELRQLLSLPLESAPDQKENSPEKSQKKVNNENLPEKEQETADSGKSPFGDLLQKGTGTCTEGAQEIEEATEKPKQERRQRSKFRQPDDINKVLLVDS